jgi:uncharacterized membrane protein YhaH (DUF805 family)
MILSFQLNYTLRGDYMDLIEILRNIAVPRPNHSEALEQVASYIKDLLTSWDIPFVVQEFSLRHYSLFFLGLATLILAVLFFILILKRKPLPALITVLIILLVLILEVEMNIHPVSSLMTKPSENIVVSFKAPDAVRELIFSAHYDSKTDFYDHVQRKFVTRLLPLFLVLALLLSVWTFFVKRYDALKKTALKALTILLTAIFVIYCFFAFLRLGGFIFMSKEKESLGAVDNGTAVVTLLAIARDIKDGNVNIGKSNITILFTSGEEVGLQGARWYAQERFKEEQNRPELPVFLINLEVVAQSGNLVHWKRVGKLFRFLTPDPDLIKRINRVWRDISGKPMDVIDKISDDSFEFGDVGIPFITVGHSGLPGLGMGGLHRKTDNMERFSLKNLKLMIKTLERYIESY